MDWEAIVKEICELIAANAVHDGTMMLDNYGIIPDADCLLSIAHLDLLQTLEDALCQRLSGYRDIVDSRISENI